MTIQQHNPPHVGEFLYQVYIKPLGKTINGTAKVLGVSQAALSRLVNGKSGLSPEMAIRLEKAFGRTAESWLAMQDNYDLWHKRSDIDVSKIKSLYEPAIANCGEY